MALIQASIRRSGPGMPGPVHPFLWAAVALVAACADGVVGPGETLLVQALDSTFTFSFPDLDADPSRPVEPPPSEQSVGSLHYRARVTFDDRGRSGFPEENLMRLELTVRNGTSEGVEVPLEGCALRPRAHRDPARTGPPVWAPARSWSCAQQPYMLAIGPGDATILRFPLSSVMVASAFPEDGRYYFTFRLARQDTTLWFPAGSADVRLRVPDLAYEVRVRAVGAYAARAAVGITNLNPVAAAITMGWCGPELWLYTDEDRTEVGRRWYPRGKVCPAREFRVIVGPGETVHVPHAATVLHLSELVRAGGADRGGIDPGLYHLSVVFRHNERRYLFPAGTIYLW